MTERCITLTINLIDNASFYQARWDEFDIFRGCADAAFKECPIVFAYGYLESMALGLISL